MIVTPSRVLGCLVPSLLLLIVLAGCAGAAALASVAPEDGVVIENPSDDPVRVVYEHVSDEIDELATLEPGASVVVGAMFEGVEAPCVTGRLIALDGSGAEVDELYFVCRGKTWVIAGS